MRVGGGMIGTVLCGWWIVTLGGCVSLNDHRRLRANQRTIIAEKEQLSQELFDERSVTDSLRIRIESLDRELSTKDELLVNLRRENDLLDEMRTRAETALEDTARNATLPAISISGPRLPLALDNALQDFANQNPSAVAYDANRGAVKWTSDLLFAPGSDVVREGSIDTLQRFSAIIKSAAAVEFEVLVIGHTDNQPVVKSRVKHPSNWHLSAHRAIAVASVLQRGGYSTGRIGIMGYGEYRPIVDNSTPDGQSKNRRVEILLVPRGTVGTASRTITVAGEGERVAFVPFQR